MSPLDRVTVVQGDITTQEVDAIVNAAKGTLLGGGGVDGAIHNAAGPELLAACETLPGITQTGPDEEHPHTVRCPTGEARLTMGFNLPATYVIHTVGPVFYGGDNGEPELLASCYLNSLRLAALQGIRTIAFPNISTGIYGYPPVHAAVVSLSTILRFLLMDTRIQEVRLVSFDEQGARLANTLLEMPWDVKMVDGKTVVTLAGVAS